MFDRLKVMATRTLNKDYYAKMATMQGWLEQWLSCSIYIMIITSYCNMTTHSWKVMYTTLLYVLITCVNMKSTKLQYSVCEQSLSILSIGLVNDT